MNNNFRLQILLSVFITLLIGMNILWGKLISVFWISLSVGIFMIPITFLITDIVSDVYWPKVVQRFIYLWILSLILTFLYAQVFVLLEPNERFKWMNDASPDWMINTKTDEPVD